MTEAVQESMTDQEAERLVADEKERKRRLEEAEERAAVAARLKQLRARALDAREQLKRRIEAGQATLSAFEKALALLEEIPREDLQAFGVEQRHTSRGFWSAGADTLVDTLSASVRRAQERIAMMGKDAKAREEQYRADGIL